MSRLRAVMLRAATSSGLDRVGRLRTRLQEARSAIEENHREAAVLADRLGTLEERVIELARRALAAGGDVSQRTDR